MATFDVDHVDATDAYIASEGAGPYTTTFAFTLTCSDCSEAPVGGYADLEAALEDLDVDSLETITVTYGAVNEVEDVNPDDQFFI